MGERSKRITNLPYMLGFAASTGIPTKIFMDMTGKAMKQRKYDRRYDTLVHNIKDFFFSPKVIRNIGSETILVPFAEIHRPKVKGCKSSFTTSYKSSRDYLISLKVFGIGAGINLGREFGSEEVIETGAECIQLVYPVTFEWQECESRGVHL